MMVTIVGLILGNVLVRVIKLFRLRGLPKGGMNLIIVPLQFQLNSRMDAEHSSKIYIYEENGKPTWF